MHKLEVVLDTYSKGLAGKCKYLLEYLHIKKFKYNGIKLTILSRKKL